MHTGGPLGAPLPWQGAAMMTLGLAAFVGRAGDNRLHRHYAVQIVITGEDPIRLWHAGDSFLAGGIVGCPAGTSHRLEPSAQRLAIVYLEPTSPLGRIANTRFRSAPVMSGASRPDLLLAVSEAIQRSAPTEVEEAMRGLLNTRAGKSALPMDPRISQVLETHVFPTVPPPLAAAADSASLSASRFSHLFARDMGIAYRAFVKWRKLLLAVQAISAGADLTRAAHEAGFADSAHFSRTFVDMFGLAPSQAFGQLTLEQAAHGHAA